MNGAMNQSTTFGPQVYVGLQQDKETNTCYDTSVLILPQKENIEEFEKQIIVLLCGLFLGLIVM